MMIILLLQLFTFHIVVYVVYRDLSVPYCRTCRRDCQGTLCTRRLADGGLDKLIKKINDTGVQTVAMAVVCLKY